MIEETANGQQVNVVEESNEPDPWEPEESVASKDEKVDWPEEEYIGE